MTLRSEGSKILPYIQLHILLIINSLGGVCSKTASRQEFMSLPFLFFYGLLLLDLAFYALMWQQILKKMPLTTAYMNKAVTIFWGMVWGIVFFGETLTAANIIGCIIVLAGVCLVVSGNE